MTTLADRLAVCPDGHDPRSCRPRDHLAGEVPVEQRLPDMDGLALQSRLNDIGCMIPVIVITGHGNVESARTAFRSRAVDFLQKLGVASIPDLVRLSLRAGGDVPPRA